MNNYEIESKLGKMLENNFVYHSPKGDQPDRYVALREAAEDLAYLIIKNTPPSREPITGSD